MTTSAIAFSCYRRGSEHLNEVGVLSLYGTEHFRDPRPGLHLKHKVSIARVIGIMHQRAACSWARSSTDCISSVAGAFA